MNKPIQKRAIATREKLLATAKALIENDSFEALRVEDVVKSAGVAKGTFFSHFKDKDALMAEIIGARMAELITEMAEAPAPQDVDQMIKVLRPLVTFITSERYVFDVMIRYSGAAAITELGPIAEQFDAQIALFAGWISEGPYRHDIDPVLAGEGVSAFVIQAVALTFCARHGAQDLELRLRSYLTAWLLPES